MMMNQRMNLSSFTKPGQKTRDLRFTKLGQKTRDLRFTKPGHRVHVLAILGVAMLFQTASVSAAADGATLFNDSACEKKWYVLKKKGPDAQQLPLEQGDSFFVKKYKELSHESNSNQTAPRPHVEIVCNGSTDMLVHVEQFEGSEITCIKPGEFRNLMNGSKLGLDTIDYFAKKRQETHDVSNLNALEENFTICLAFAQKIKEMGADGRKVDLGMISKIFKKLELCDVLARNLDKVEGRPVTKHMLKSVLNKFEECNVLAAHFDDIEADSGRVDTQMLNDVFGKFKECHQFVGFLNNNAVPEEFKKMEKLVELFKRAPECSVLVEYLEEKQVPTPGQIRTATKNINKKKIWFVNPKESKRESEPWAKDIRQIKQGNEDITYTGMMIVGAGKGCKKGQGRIKFKFTTKGPKGKETQEEEFLLNASEIQNLKEPESASDDNKARLNLQLKAAMSSRNSKHPQDNNAASAQLDVTRRRRRRRLATMDRLLKEIERAKRNA